MIAEGNFTWHYTFMYWVYILENWNDKGWYIGMTGDLERRLTEHKNGHGSRTTSSKQGWEMIYCEGYKNKKDAAGREEFLKSGAGRRFIKKQLRNYLESYKLLN